MQDFDGKPYDPSYEEKDLEAALQRYKSQTYIKSEVDVSQTTDLKKRDKLIAKQKQDKDKRELEFERGELNKLKSRKKEIEDSIGVEENKKIELVKKKQ